MEEVPSSAAKEMIYHTPYRTIAVQHELPEELKKAANLSYPLTLLYLIRAILGTIIAIGVFIGTMGLFGLMGYAIYQDYIHGKFP